MRVAIISDVHANLAALRAVLLDMDRLGIERIIHAGDIVGYYPFPNEVIRTFQERKIESVRGNHDQAALIVDTSNMNPMASEAARWTAKRLELDSLRYLKVLKKELHLTIGAVRTSVYHGSPFFEDEYVYEEDVSEGLLERSGSRLLILGHTHVPFVKVTDRGTVVNPGSVGQPRDHDPRSSWILYDSTKASFDLRRVDYDIASLAEAINKAGLPEALIERLYLGV